MTLGTPTRAERQETVDDRQLVDPMVVARRTAHRRSILQTDLADLVFLIDRRRAAEGQYVRELKELRASLDEKGFGAGKAGNGRAVKVETMEDVARHLREEVDRTESAHAAVFAAYEQAAESLTVLAGELDRTGGKSHAAVQASLGMPTTTRSGHSQTPPVASASTASRLPDRLDDTALAYRLLDLHSSLERTHARGLKHVFKRLEAEREEARASLAFWIARGDGLEGWHPQRKLGLVMDRLREPFARTPAVLPNDIHRLIIRAAIEPMRVSLPFLNLATSVLQNEQRIAQRLLRTCCLVHASWRDIALPLLMKQLSLQPINTGGKDRFVLLNEDGAAWRAALETLHLTGARTAGYRLLTTSAPFDSLRTIIGLPIPHVDEAPVRLRGLSALVTLSVIFPHAAPQSQALDLVFADLAGLSSLRLETHHDDLHETFAQLGRIDLPRLTELQLSGVSFRGRSPSSVSVQTLALLEKHGGRLHSLLLESTHVPLNVDWVTLGRAMLGYVPLLRHLSTSIVELGLVFERQFRDGCALVFGSSALEVVRNSLVAGSRCRTLLEFCRRLAGVDHLLPWQMRCRLRFRSTLTSLMCWQLDFALEPYQQSTDLALAAHYLRFNLGLTLVDRHGVPHREFWVAQSPAEIEAQLLQEQAQRTDV